jgi:hypothetical protein
MDRAGCFFLGAGIGALTMYYFDPERGRGRRAVCEDQWAARGRRTMRTFDKAGRDLANRATGLVHEAGHLVRGETPPEDGHHGSSFDIMHEHLAPGTRLLLGALGGGLFAWGLMADAPEACVLGTVGAAVMLPALTGRGVAGGLGVMPGRGGETEQPQARPSSGSTSTATERRGEAVPVM